MARNAAAASPPVRQPLTRERIVAAALALIDRDGLAAFSIRGLGAALGCEPMSIYHYFPSKGHLQDALVDDALASVLTDPPGADPLDRLRAVARSYRALAHRHPKLFPLIAVHRLNTPTGVRVIEEVLKLVHAAVADDRLAAQYFRVLGTSPGAALDETAGYANALGDGARERGVHRRELPASRRRRDITDRSGRGHVRARTEAFSAPCAPHLRVDTPTVQHAQTRHPFSANI
jgi:AcrR family transcriptional regulator